MGSPPHLLLIALFKNFFLKKPNPMKGDWTLRAKVNICITGVLLPFATFGVGNISEKYHI